MGRPYQTIKKEKTGNDGMIEQCTHNISGPLSSQPTHRNACSHEYGGNQSKFRKIVVFILLFLQCSLLFCDTITFSGNNLKTILAKGKERTVLTGNAVLTSDDNDIRADNIELYGEDFTFVRCTGHIRVINKKKEIDVTAEQMYYDRNQKMIRFQGNVIMEDKKNETIVKGGYLENWEDEELVIIQLGVRILKKDMACRSEFARYYRKEERLELSGLPRVIRKDDEYTALKIYVNLKNDEVTLEGNVTGEVKWEDKKADNGEPTIEPEPTAGQEILQPEETPIPKD
jgi:lipopolysaccharide export system protein LptA